MKVTGVKFCSYYSNCCPHAKDRLKKLVEDGAISHVTTWYCTAYGKWLETGYMNPSTAGAVRCRQCRIDYPQSIWLELVPCA